MKKALILFSGGLDSTTCLALAKSRGYTCHALSFRYGQRHTVELTAAENIAAQMDATHHVIDLPVGAFAGSALTDSRLSVPDYHGGEDIPATYVPARNTIFLAFALGLAETLDIQDIFIGVSAIDYSGYPDCRPEYIKAFEKMANLATKSSIEGNTLRIHTPLIELSKAETIQLGHQLGVCYKETVSCYQANDKGEGCWRCDSCMLRQRGFAEAGIADPTRYTG